MWADGGVYAVLAVAECGWWLDSQDRAEVFPDILCSRVRWCSHAWPAWTTEHTLTLSGGAHTSSVARGNIFPQSYVL